VVGVLVVVRVAVIVVTVVVRVVVSGAHGRGAPCVVGGNGLIEGVAAQEGWLELEIDGR
jgi:hypothetical protein